MPDTKEEAVKGDIHEQNLFDELVGAVSAQKAAFCCGGEVQVSNNEDLLSSRFENLTYDDGEATSASIVLRWDLSSGKTVGKLTLPPPEGADGVIMIEELLKDCTPATFGKAGEEVLDEDYRKAAKLDANQFSTNFNPYDVGIVDAIAQILLPGIAKPFADGKSTFEDHLGVVAELYKLNIYSGPSGKFRAHVDTPRGAKQFGSLVICLPYLHEGGQLRVAHQGQDTIFDWSQKDAEKIQWAAFYSDCEHEVLEVKSGHRITLTYNLYVQEHLGGIMRQNPSVNSDHYVLSNKVMDLLKSPEFMTEGDALGFYCQHAYAHTNRNHRNRLPYALKGVDAIFYSIFHRIGLDVKVAPVMKGMPDDDYVEHLQRRDRKRRNKLQGCKLIGTELHGLILSSTGGYKEDEQATTIVTSKWQSNWWRDVVWFNEPGPMEVAMVHMAHGNEPSLQWHYSSAAILVKIPASGSELREKVIKG